MSAVRERVVAMVAEVLGIKPEEVIGDCSFTDDLGADSLGLVELVMALEEEFSCEISDEEAEQMATVQQVIDYISKRIE